MLETKLMVELRSSDKEIFVLRVNSFSRWTIILINVACVVGLLTVAIVASDGTIESTTQNILDRLAKPLVIAFAILQFGSLLSVLFNRIEFTDNHLCFKRWYRKDKCFHYAEIVDVIEREASDSVYLRLRSGELVDIPKVYSKNAISETGLAKQINDHLRKSGYHHPNLLNL